MVLLYSDASIYLQNQSSQMITFISIISKFWSIKVDRSSLSDIKLKLLIQELGRDD